MEKPDIMYEIMPKERWNVIYTYISNSQSVQKSFLNKNAMWIDFPRLLKIINTCKI